MAHYAFLDENNIVKEVIVGINESKTIEGENTEEWYGKFRNQVCKRTSYNDNVRKNYASIGYTYDEIRDAFIPPKVNQSWVLNEETCLWESPIPYPSDGKFHTWVECIKEWVFQY